MQRNISFETSGSMGTDYLVVSVALSPTPL